MSQRNTGTTDESLVNDNMRQFATIEQFQVLRTQLQKALSILATVAEERGMSYEEPTDGFGYENFLVRPLAEVLRQRSARLDAPFRLAVVGEFSRGKSSLINALLSRELLTSDHRPNTAAQTILKHGQPERFMVTFLPITERPAETRLSANLKTDIASFTSDSSIDSEQDEEAQNSYETLLKGERKSLSEEIEKVEIWFESDLLRQMEIEIIDTPGLGAVFKTHEQVTLKVMHDVDAIIFTVQIDPGVDGREVAFLRLIREHVSKIFFVVTKADWIPEQQSLIERVEYIGQTIQIKAQIPVKHIFPISAWLAMEGAREKSGFPQFLPALEQFLVRSNGVNRLVSPLRFTRTQARHVQRLLNEYIQRLGHSRKELEDELQALNKEAQHIRAKQEDLLNFVEERIKGIRLDAIDAIDDLPALIRIKVEREIESLSANDLRQANIFIQPAIKEAVTAWLEQRKKNFASKITALNQEVKRTLIALLKNLQFDEEQISLIRSIALEIDLPIDTGSFTDTIGDKIMQSLLSMGVSNTIASVAATFVQAAGNILGALKRGWSRLFGGGNTQPQPQNNINDVRQRLYSTLLQNIPGTTVNTYQGVVYGYQQNGRSIDGVRQVVRKAFTDWGNDLMNDISSLVNNNLDTRLHNLTSQLESQRSGLQENEDERARVLTMQTELQDVLKIVDDIQKQLRNLGVS
jgi:GTPase SAR1 family protein